MKKLVLLILLLTIGGCAAFQATPPMLTGQLLGLHEGTTLYVMSKALTHGTISEIWWLPGTQRYVFFALIENSGWGSVFVDLEKPATVELIRNAQIQGQLFTGTDIGNFAREMQNSGWKIVGPGAVPAFLRTAVKIGVWSRIASSSSPMPLLTVYGAFSPENMPFQTERSNQ